MYQFDLGTIPSSVIRLMLLVVVDAEMFLLLVSSSCVVS